MITVVSCEVQFTTSGSVSVSASASASLFRVRFSLLFISHGGAHDERSKGGRRHVLMLPVNALVKGLNQVSMNDPLLEGWMGVGPSELAR